MGAGLTVIICYSAGGVIIVMVWLLIRCTAACRTRWLGSTASRQPNATNVNANVNVMENGLSNMELERISVSFFSCESTMTTTMMEDSECAICLENMEIGDQYRVLPVCGHWFHDHCIVTWLTKSRTCPLCRASAVAIAIDDIV